MYSKYVKLRNDKGITDYRVAIDTGIRRSTFQIGKVGEVNLKRISLKFLRIILACLLIIFRG